MPTKEASGPPGTFQVLTCSPKILFKQTHRFRSNSCKHLYQVENCAELPAGGLCLTPAANEGDQPSAFCAVVFTGLHTPELDLVFPALDEGPGTYRCLMKRSER